MTHFENCQKHYTFFTLNPLGLYQRRRILDWLKMADQNKQIENMIGKLLFHLGIGISVRINQCCFVSLSKKPLSYIQQSPGNTGKFHFYIFSSEAKCWKWTSGSKPSLSINQHRLTNRSPICKASGAWARNLTARLFPAESLFRISRTFEPASMHVHESEWPFPWGLGISKGNSQPTPVSNTALDATEARAKAEANSAISVEPAASLILCPTRLPSRAPFDLLSPLTWLFLLQSSLSCKCCQASFPVSPSTLYLRGVTFVAATPWLPSLFCGSCDFLALVQKKEGVPLIEKACSKFFDIKNRGLGRIKLLIESFYLTVHPYLGPFTDYSKKKNSPLTINETWLKPKRRVRSLGTSRHP